MKDNSTQNRYEIAGQLGVPNERISSIRQIDDVLTFSINGASYDCRLTKTGHVKKNSVRLA